jgi:hypothetical protein
MTPMLSSCWTGRNAAKRMMNVLSPKMPDAKFKEYARWQLGRGCNTVHPILCNARDGECAGYSPYGPTWSRHLDGPMVTLMLSRMAMLRGMGFGVVPWVWTDDSRAFTGRPLGELKQALLDFGKAGLFAVAGCVVLGLELDEYWKAAQVAALVPVLREAAPGALVGLHQSSDKLSYAALSDVFFWQTNPGKKAAQVRKLVAAAVKKLGGKPLVAFELDRKENRPLASAALEAGAVGVGNW